MAKSQAKKRSDKIFKNLEHLSLSGADDGDEILDIPSLLGKEIQQAADSSRLLRMKKFRFQLLHHWLIQNFEPCKAADIGGGKGLLGFLLQKSGWDVTIIDPIQQSLPEKYKDIATGTRVKIKPGEALPHIQSEFVPEMAENYDLLIGMHAHGCNVMIIDAAASYGCAFVIFPCCVIDEPFYPPLGVHWLESLADYALHQGHIIHPFRLNFKGQNIGLYGRRTMKQALAVKTIFHTWIMP